MSKYTVIDHNGEKKLEGATLREAAEHILGYDGHEHEFRRCGDWLELWVSQFSRNSPLGGRPLVRARDMFASMPRELSNDHPRRALAEEEIFGFVIDHADRWNNQRGMTDEQWENDNATD